MLQTRASNEYRYAYQADNLQLALKETRQVCPNCIICNQKLQDLTWTYEQLLSAKEIELETVSKIVNQLDVQLSKTQYKVNSLAVKLKTSEMQVQALMRTNNEFQNILSYFKTREVQLLSQLKITQNELFTKEVHVKDEAEAQEQQNIQQLVNGNKQHNAGNIIKREKSTKQMSAELIPVIQQSHSLGKILQKSLCELEKMGQQKIIVEVKHRMALLRAASLSVLK